MKTLVALLLFILACSCTESYGEVEKTGVPCKEGVCFYWLPRLPAVEGWHQDPDASNAYRVNTQVPNGSTFATAEAVIYGRALCKPEMPDVRSMDAFIRDDRNQFLSRDPNIAVAEIDSLKTDEGKVFRSFTFFPKEKGDWEQVSYGEESDCYLIITISSRTREGFLRSLEAYKRFVRLYKEKP